MPTTLSPQAAQARAKAKADAKKKKSEESKAGASTTTEDTSGNPPQNVGSGKSASLSGIPLGTEVTIGLESKTSRIPGIKGIEDYTMETPVTAKVQYTTDSPYTVYAAGNNSDRANLLIQMASIPGLYGKGEAPTLAYIQSMGTSVSFRKEDYSALTKLMIHADSTGQDYKSSLLTFYKNPSLASQYFGKTSGSGGVTATPAIELEAELSSRFMDLFDITPDKKLAAKYAKEVANAQIKAGTTNIGQLKEDIFLKYVEQTAQARFSTVKATPGTEDDMQIEAGALGSYLRSIRNTYADNGIPTSEKQIYADALKSIRSKQAYDNIIEKINMQAAAQMPAIKDQILKGFKAKDILSPYVKSYEKIYGKTPTVADLTEVAAGQTLVPVATWEQSQWAKDSITKTDYYKETINNDLKTVLNAFTGAGY
jgi:hypothetical protein